MLKVGSRSRKCLVALLVVVPATFGLIAARPAVTAPYEKALSPGHPSIASEFGRTKWERLWSDNFAGPAGAGVNQAIWVYDTGRGVFGTGEIETMTSSASNVHLDGQGNLDITAISRGASWTSGRIETQSNGFSAPDGGEMMVTASIKQPDPAHGAGYSPAFWLLGPGPSPQSGEVDILEDVDGLSEASSTFHCGNLTKHNSDGTFGPCHEFHGLSSGLQRCTGCQISYHTYSVIIDRRDESDQQIRWYIDGRRFFAVSESQVGSSAWTEAVDHGFSIIFDLAVGGSFPDGICGCTGPGAATSSGATMSIRDVAVYVS